METNQAHLLYKKPLLASKCSQDECMEQRQVIYFLFSPRMAIKIFINFFFDGIAKYGSKIYITVYFMSI